jgi:hypothetical protein
VSGSTAATGVILAAASWAAWMMAPAVSRASRVTSSYWVRASLVT